MIRKGATLAPCIVCKQPATTTSPLGEPLCDKCAKNTGTPMSKVASKFTFAR